MQPIIQGLGLVLFVVVCLGTGGLGAWATTPEIDGWYGELAKPSWNPPAYVFGPVWSTLYVMMAISGWLVWRQNGFSDARLPLAWFAVQLILNLGWSWIFFRLHQPGWAFFEILLLWGAIAITTWKFFELSRLAGWLLIPYLAWVTFAAFLNFSIWRLNSGT